MPAASNPSLSKNEQYIRAVVLRHVIRREDIMRSAGDKLAELGYFHSDPLYHAVFDTAWLYFDAYNIMPPLEVLILELRMRSTEDPIGLPYSSVRAMEDLLADWWDLVEWAVPYVRDQLQMFFKDQGVAALRGLVSGGNDTLDSFHIDLDKAVGLVTDNPIAALTPESAFADIPQSIKLGELKPTGVDFIDDALGGGLMSTEALLIITLTGGGKTTIGQQIADCQVKADRVVAYFSFEQPLEGDMAHRQYTLATSAKRSDFESGYENIPPDVLERLLKVQPLWKKNFAFFDCRATQMRDVTEIYTSVDSLKAAGYPVSFIIIDWWGMMRAQLMVHQATSTSDASTQRAQAMQWAQRLLKGAKDRGIPMIVLQQIRGAFGQRGTNARPTANDAQEDSNFGNQFEFVAALTKMNQDNACTIIFDKARRTSKGEAKITLDGPHCRFIRDHQAEEAAQETGANQGQWLIDEGKKKSE